MSTDPTGIKIAFDPTVQRMTGVTAHGFISFDVPFITEIEPGLWQGGCRNGLILPRFFKHLVSLYPWESYKAKHELDSHLTVKAHDSLDQDMGQVDAIASWVNVARESGPVLVHCQAGLNRSSLVVARALMLGGMSADKAIRILREKRSAACLCNSAFEAWLRAQENDVPDTPEGAEIKRARCLYCGKARPVTKAGNIRKHWVTGGPTTTQAGKRVVCGGSGRQA